MAILVVGLIVFIGMHALPWHTGLRTQVVNKLGANTYRALFSVVAVTGLILIIVGKARADFHSLWIPPSWGRLVALPLMFIALILLPAANMPNNIKRVVRHPMLIGIIIWAGAHLLANGDLASLLLFGSFAVYSVIAIISGNHRGKNANLPVVPFGKDILVVVIGTVAFAVLLFAHPYLFGVAVIH